MRHVTITPNGQKRVLLVQSGTLGLALKQMADTSENAARAEAAAQEAEAARDDTISGLLSKASKDGSDITSAVEWRDALDLGDSSTLDVGSTSGTVAAGDDDRILEVADKLNKAVTLAALKALPSAKGQVFVCGRSTSGDHYAGTFGWVSGDQSANVTRDPGEGVWVAPASDASGASGAWRRVYSGPALLDWFSGVDPTGATGSKDGLQRAFNSGFPLYAGTPGAEYLVEGDSLSVPSNFSLDGQGCTFRRTGYKNGWIIKNSTAGLTHDNVNITLRNIKFADKPAQGDRGSGIKMDGVTGLKLIDLSFRFTAQQTPGEGNGAWCGFVAGKDISIYNWTADTRTMGLNSDGIHFGQIENLVMNGFHMVVGDDGLGLHYPPDSYGYLDGPSKNVIIGNGYIESVDANGIRLGSYGVAGSPNPSSPEGRWENVVFHDIAFGPVAGNCVTIQDNRSTAELTSPNKNIVFDNLNFGEQNAFRGIYIEGVPNIASATYSAQRNWTDITIRNTRLTSKRQNAPMVLGGGVGRLSMVGCEMNREMASASATESIRVVFVDRLEFRDCRIKTQDTGNGFRFAFVKEVALCDCEITGSGAEFSLVSIDRPADHGVKMITHGGSFLTPQTAGTQMIIRSTGSGTVEEFTVQGTSFLAGSGTATNILAATLYRYNPASQSYLTSGTTANRPSSPPSGREYFDTTLGKPIWFKSPGWVDATGAAA